ncbi:ABC transporter permease [Enterococcus sp. HY326]|uniref:ABC transporter permease n=1 Tax=Enterococcus sp. HY326 TaxID=2971265 RepID=UPI0022400046|nr:ABC transporter permease [Enterococcus sp. HY326]
MNFIQRALASVTRRKGKSLILFLVIFILGNVIAGAIAIQQSTANVEKKMKNDLGATATAEIDPEFDWETSEAPENLSEETIQEIGNLSYVKEYDYSVRAYINTANFKTMQPDYGDEGGVVYGNSEQPQLELVGTNLETPLSFSDKIVDLVDGRYFTAEEIANGAQVGIFSKKVSEENGFSVGDQVVVDSQNYIYSETEESTYEKGIDFPVEVIGIFDPQVIETKQEDSEQGNQQFFDQVYVEATQFNSVYMPNRAVQEINVQYWRSQFEADPDMYGGEFDEEETNQFYATPNYQLNSPEDVEAFRQEAETLLPSAYIIRASTDTYDEVGGSMKKLSQISGYVVIVAVIATLVIISLVVVLFLRDRKHELGIYLAIGEHRRNVVLQILIELLIISIIAMGLSLVTGNFLGGSLSESLLQSDMLASNGNNMDNMSYYYDVFANNPTLTADQIQNAYEVTFSMGYIVTFILTGLLTVFASALLPLIYILRLNPKKIMM